MQLLASHCQPLACTSDLCFSHPLALPHSFPSTLCVARCSIAAPRTGVLRQWSRAVTRSLSKATAVLLGKGQGSEEQDEGYEERQEKELAVRGGWWVLISTGKQGGDGQGGGEGAGRRRTNGVKVIRRRSWLCEVGGGFRQENGMVTRSCEGVSGGRVLGRSLYSPRGATRSQRAPAYPGAWRLLNRY